MRPSPHRWVLPCLVAAWALSHATVFGDGPAPVRQALDRKITLDYSGQTLLEALQHLRQKTGLELSLDQTAALNASANLEAATGQPVLLKSDGGTVGQALRKLLAEHQLTFIVYEGTVLITSPEMAAYRLLRQHVDVDAEQAPARKVMRDLAGRHGVNLVIDPRTAKLADSAVSLHLEGATLETALRVVAELAGLKAVQMDNVVFVTSEERAEKIRKEEKELNVLQTLAAGQALAAGMMPGGPNLGIIGGGAGPGVAPGPLGIIPIPARGGLQPADPIAPPPAFEAPPPGGAPPPPPAKD